MEDVEDSQWANVLMKTLWLLSKNSVFLDLLVLLMLLVQYDYFFNNFLKLLFSSPSFILYIYVFLNILL